jgi:hypothetical protein
MKEHRMSRVRARFTAVVVALLATLGASLATAPAASAAGEAWVYVSTPTWLGNCAFGKDKGRVTRLLMAVGNTYSSTKWDTGDDIVYAKVILGKKQRVSYEAFCNKKWPGYYQPGVQQTITPTRKGQTVWVGPAGVRYN